jgi:hypothetical protein
VIKNTAEIYSLYVRYRVLSAYYNLIVLDRGYRSRTLKVLKLAQLVVLIQVCNNANYRVPLYIIAKMYRLQTVSHMLCERNVCYIDING